MPGIARAPPVVGLALAAGAGAVLFHLGVPPTWTLWPILLAVLPKLTSSRPMFVSSGLALALVGGFFSSRAGDRSHSDDCRLHLRDQETLGVQGRLVGPVLQGRGEIQPLDSGNECSRPLRFVVANAPVLTEGERLPTETERLVPGARVHLSGVWRKDPVPSSPSRAGYLRVDSAFLGSPRPPGSLVEARAALGGWVQRRIASLFPESAGLVSALIWARKEGLDPGLREAFARTGTAHLLAISGFHVGVFAALLLTLLSRAGFSHRTRYLLCTAGIWFYVGAIGLPDAAVRAGALFSVFTAGRWINRPVIPSGALATAFLVLLLLDPLALTRVGFQLSMAGTAGLLVGYRPLLLWLRSTAPPWTPLVLLQGVAAGMAASLTTLPFVAWHFSRVSLVGIPFSLLATPLVALAIPGILTSLVLSMVFGGAARFLASGVDLALQALTLLIQGGAALPFASVWVSHPVVLTGVLAGSVAGILVQVHPGDRKKARPWIVLGALAGGVALGNPMARFLSLGTVELVVLDVGQGDATLIRSPGGRWILVDAGPRTQNFDAGERRILPYLERRGVQALEAMILTHPDMDHVGGAAAILAQVPVGRVLGPGVPAGTHVFIDALESALQTAVPWQPLHTGDSLNLDGMALRVLAPDERGEADPAWEDVNAASVVLELRFGAFSALLTGDAPASSEERFLPRILSQEIQVLKVGHHGSTTSTSGDLLLNTHPAMALISVGTRNRFGHPAREVLARLEEAGVQVLRTDLHGNLVLRAYEDGAVRVRIQHHQDSGASLVLRR